MKERFLLPAWPVMLFIFIFFTGCAKKSQPTDVPSHIDKIEFQFSPQIEDPQSEADLNKYTIKFKSNFKRKQPLRVFRALPDGNWLELGSFSPQTKEFSDKVNETNVILRYRFLSEMPGGKTGAIFPVAVFILPDRAVRHSHLNELSHSTIRLSRLLLLEGSTLVTQGKSAQIEVDELIVRRGAKITVKDSDHKWIEDRHLPAGKFELTARKARGILRVEPEFPRDHLRNDELQEKPNPSLGSQEMQIQVAESPDFQVQPHLEPAPVEKAERETWQRFLRPVRSHVADASFELCGPNMVPVETFAGVFAREVRPGKREFLYIPAHQGHLGRDSEANGLFEKVGLRSVSPFRCGANGEFQIPKFEGLPPGQSETLVRVNPDDATAPPEVKSLAALHLKLLDLNRAVRAKGVYAGFTFPRPGEMRSHRTQRSATAGATAAEKFMEDLVAQPEKVAHFLQNRYRKSLLLKWENSEIEADSLDMSEPLDVVINYHPGLTVETMDGQLERRP